MSGLKLSHAMGEWQATFEATLVDLIESLLVDGPVTGAVVVEEGGRDYHGTVLEVTRNGEITIDFNDIDGYRTAYLPVAGIESLEVL